MNFPSKEYDVTPKQVLIASRIAISKPLAVPHDRPRPFRLAPNVRLRPQEIRYLAEVALAEAADDLDDDLDGFDAFAHAPLVDDEYEVAS